MANQIEKETHVNLVKEALAQEAYKAKIFRVEKIVIDPRVRLKCRVPLCNAYGHNLMCPPNSLDLDELKEILTHYQWALLVQIKTPYAEGFLGAKKVHKLINHLEKEANRMGLVYAAGFIGGECKLCEQCVGQGSQEPCRHPFQARPSMEGVGIDVLRTAKNIGLDFEINHSPELIWNGLLLLE